MRNKTNLFSLFLSPKRSLLMVSVKESIVNEMTSLKICDPDPKNSFTKAEVKS